MIELVKVFKSYKKHIIFNNVNITFPEQKKCFIKGINGSGKSVLLKLIAGFSTPDSGFVKVNGMIIGKDVDFVQNAGICINSPEFITNLSGLDNLLELAKINNTTNEKEILELCKMFSLEKDLNKKYGTYSLGMKQKMRLIQAFMENPDILILDEPFDALDKSSKKVLKDYLNSFIASQGRYLLYTGHSSESESFADLVYEIENENVILSKK